MRGQGDLAFTQPSRRRSHCLPLAFPRITGERLATVLRGCDGQAHTWSCVAAARFRNAFRAPRFARVCEGLRGFAAAAVYLRDVLTKLVNFTRNLHESTCSVTRP